MNWSHHQQRQLWTRAGHAGVVLRYVPRHDVLSTALELIHPGNLGPLPPAPLRVAYQAEFAGIAKREEFFTWR